MRVSASFRGSVRVRVRVRTPSRGTGRVKTQEYGFVPFFKKKFRPVSRLGLKLRSGPNVMCRLGPRVRTPRHGSVRVSASFQIFALTAGVKCPLPGGE